jgi:hypothetical protein
MSIPALRVAGKRLAIVTESVTKLPSAQNMEDTWIPLRQAAQNTRYSQEYLSLLARTGRLEAVKRGRVWYTTRRALDAYRQSLRDA